MSAIILSFIVDLVCQHDDVVAVGALWPVARVVVGVGVRTAPLKVNKVSKFGLNLVGGEIVFGGGIGLYDVASLSSNPHIVDCATLGSRRAASDGKHVCAVLESAAELISIDGELQWDDRFQLVAL